MKKKQENIIPSPLEMVDTVQDVVSQVESEVEARIAPVRKSIVKRFPTLFLLAVTFGVSLVLFSLEVILSQSAFVMERPWSAFALGLTILIITGTLYRKLG